MTISLKPSVLMVGEDARLGVVKHALEHDGFCALTVSEVDGHVLPSGLDPDLIILGAGADARSALTTYAELSRAAKSRHVPVVLLPQQGETRSPTAGGLGRGSRPQNAVLSAELLARIKALTRSLSGSEHAHVLTFLDVLMDLSAQQVYRNGRRVSLGPIEFRLLEHFLRHPRQVFSRGELLELVWRRSARIVSRTVDVHVGRLRKALNACDAPDYIRTVHRRGYSLDLAE